MAFNQSEQGVVLADANIGTGVKLGAALAHDDGACSDVFTSESLDAQHFGVGVTTVARRAAAFFLCHGE